MLSIHVVNDRQDRQFEHAGGTLELGRGPRQQAERFVIEDPFVSRDHLELEELPDERLRVRNLSQKQAVVLGNGKRLEPGAATEVVLPTSFQIGNTAIDVEALPTEAFDKDEYQTLDRPKASSLEQSLLLGSLGDAPSAQTVANWLETVITLQRSGADLRELYNQTARALVDLVGLDLGIVLLRDRDAWKISGHYTTSSTVSSRYSRTLLAHVLKERRTYYQSLSDSKGLQAESLQSLDAVVASPIYGLNEDIVGVLYGVRTYRGRSGGIRPLEAQVVQLLAGALGASLVRTVATKTRTQFEQFFSPELTRELERDPNLLEGRNHEITVLFSDMRGFTRLSERLGPEATCRVVRDVMERLSDRITLYGGTVVNYIGDGILAMWNAPIAQSDHVQRACRAALAMMAELPALNARWEAEIGTALAIGIGINTGPALVGNTGTGRRLQYGPFGPTVNLASRIQDATKRVGVPLLVSGTIRGQLRSGFRTRSVGPVEIPGVSGDVELFELSGEPGTISLSRPAE